MKIINEYIQYSKAKDALNDVNFYKHKYIDEKEQWYYAAYYTALDNYSRQKSEIRRTFFMNKLNKLEKILMKGGR